MHAVLFALDPRHIDDRVSLVLFGCSDAKESPSLAGSTSQSSRQSTCTAEHRDHQCCPQTHSKCCERRVFSVKRRRTRLLDRLEGPPKIVSAFFLKKTLFYLYFANLELYLTDFVLFANSQDFIELFSLLKHDADQTEKQLFPKAFGSDSI